ncbi:DUF523 domain-containing protein [Anoxynatronum sibiricum]|uniref:DUF523 domain-containing protein n=1 Tax=Anoxynatronum sibiricum TaxID=210623 RepID=A0ABU9VV12_9CLOT
MIAISACLMGVPCRYNGTAANCLGLHLLSADHPLMVFCPEVMGGLPTPREPAEIQNGTGADVLSGQAFIINSKGADVTQLYLSGSQKVLAVLKSRDVQAVILKENSPSCGLYHIHDGEFSGRLIEGSGVLTQLLKNHDIQVFNENQIDEISHLNG